MMQFHDIKYIKYLIINTLFGQGTFYSFRFIITFLNCMNFLPCRGLVKKSATISSVGQYSILSSPFLIQSVMKKYLNVEVFGPS